MVKVNYASLQTQSSTMSSASQSRVAGFNQLISAFDSFGGSGGELIGTGYDAARAYATSVMSPYYKGCILYSEAVADAANTLADSYAAKCGAENLDEEQLQAEIHHATSACIGLGNSIVRLESVKQTEAIKTRLNNLRNQYDAAQSQLTVAQEKLDKLLAFSAESPSACASADGYQGLVSQAMSGISVSFGGGGFALPEDLSWVSTVEQGWADREIAMENNYLSALEKVKTGEPLTEAELTAIERYAAAYPERVDASVLEYVQQARQVKAEEMKIRGLIDKVDAGKSLTDEETKTLQDYQSNHPDSNLLENVKYALDRNDTKQKEQKNIDDESKEIISKAEKAYKNGEIDDKTFQSIKSGIINFGASYVKELLQTKLTDKAVEAFTKSAIEWFTHNINATQIGRSAALVGGGTVTIATDFNPIWAQLARGAVKNGVKYGIPIVGALVDFGMQKASGESTGDALIKTGGHVVAGLAGAKVGAVVGTFIGGPVGTAIGGAVGFGLSVAGSMLFDAIYDNKDKIATGIADIGQRATQAVEDTVGKVGDAISGFGKMLGSVFSFG
ncbi:hypothetical protein D8886_05330 [Streptococcus sanguinis]|uniref:hypothetical protein n=1 Tax=Streptococcus sanguinis TaxID=1305 RepID=UPI000FC2766C|nr:hypothetical protein [Streptococcus sanguinis]RSI18022.1 hypothetical protein D8886_05330 [Streptococcus sanguinis]